MTDHLPASLLLSPLIVPKLVMRVALLRFVTQLNLAGSELTLVRPQTLGGA
jgi:ABC-type spermidine/putrescine transport system permease subunit II